LTSVYLIGSLRNPNIQEIAQQIRAAGFEVFDDWHAAGPIADDCWQEYEKARGHSYPQALKGWAAKHVFEFDKYHLDRCDIGVLALPAGKSGHLELGYMIGAGKPGYVLLDREPERFDVMYQFANGVYYAVEDLIAGLRSVGTKRHHPHLLRDAVGSDEGRGQEARRRRETALVLG
jgi:nucleoside 2-deoxyribosyltransferase